MKKLPLPNGWAIVAAGNRTSGIEQIASEDERYQAAVKYFRWWRDFTFYEIDKYIEETK